MSQKPDESKKSDEKPGESKKLDEKPKEAEVTYVKLISSDNHEFFVSREHADFSHTLKAMLDGPVIEETEQVVRLREIPSHVLRTVCQYFGYKARYINCVAEIPLFPIMPQDSLEVLMAANFLDC